VLKTEPSEASRGKLSSGNLPPMSNGQA